MKAACGIQLCGGGSGASQLNNQEAALDMNETVGASNAEFIESLEAGLKRHFLVVSISYMYSIFLKLAKCAHAVCRPTDRETSRGPAHATSGYPSSRAVCAAANACCWVGSRLLGMAQDAGSGWLGMA
eukprot:6112464-Prymnesium_polylepis.1